MSARPRSRRPLALPLAIALVAVGIGAAARADTPRTASAADLERLRGSAERDERALKQRLEEIAKEAALADGRILARGRSYVRLARVGLMPVGEGFDALVDHAARLERLHHGLEADLERSKALAAERIAIAQKLSEVRARVGTLEEQQRVVARAEDALRSQEERERAFAEAFETGRHTAVYGAVGPSDPGLAADGMAALRGRLPFPLGGRSEILPARRASSDGPGLEMRAPRGTPVRSVFAGRVAFADTYADYGKTVILDHGRRHYTVSANLEAFDVEVGDELVAGARIGSVGDSGNGPRLYFEIRVGKDTVSPGEWFGI
jgi:septal ring factor EnvC (AmiA/AmiB activator)